MSRSNAHITMDRVPLDKIPDKKKRGGKRSSLYTTAAAEAVKHPAEWVVLRGYGSTGVATSMRRGRYPAIDPADFEIEVRASGTKDGTYDLYLRYVGKIVE